MNADLQPTPHNPIPGNHAAGFFDGAGGCRLRYAIFRPDHQVPLGTVVLLQGRNETIEKYAETIRDFTARGFWVATFDWRGQGGSQRLLSDPRLGHVRRFSDYQGDLLLFLDRIVGPQTPRPSFMVAHSMGALVALSQAPDLADRIDRLVVAAPFVALGGQKLGHRLIGAIAATFCLVGLGHRPLMQDRGPLPFSQNLLTCDAGRFVRNRLLTNAHPELALGPPTARWLHETFRAIRRVASRRHLDAIRIPMIVLAPTSDRLVPHLAVEKLASQCRAARLIAIDGARHEVFQESNLYRDQALAAIDAFLPGRTVAKRQKTRQSQG